MKAIYAILGIIGAIALVGAKIIDALSVPLFIVFLILKLCGVIAWSWVAVCAPLIALAAAVIITIVCVISNAFIDPQ